MRHTSTTFSPHCRRSTTSILQRGRLASIAASLLCLAVISPPSLAAENGDDDPLSFINRPIHGFNRIADRFALRPLAWVYRQVTPKPLRNSVGNFFGNLKQPVAAANHILQGDAEAAGKTVLRFVTNTTLGLAGLMDVASEFGIEDQPTDLGLTLAAWGVDSGPYLVLPLLGPSTVRDAPAWLTQRAADPARDLEIAEGDGDLALTSLQVVNGRAGAYEIINEVLYNSADSYAAVKVSYLQRRRRQAGQIELPDLFEDEEFWEDEQWDEEEGEETGGTESTRSQE